MGDVSGPVVRCDVANGVATVTLDSPGNRNALSRALLTGLHDALDRCERPDVRVVVLTHAGPAFCAGADLKERSTGPTDSTPMVRAMQRLIGSRCPTIAAVQGPVRAGGIGLMASCDIVVVQEDVTFAFTEVRIGVAPAIISVPILQRCGWSRLAAPFLTGESFDAATARDMGLVTHVTHHVPHTVGTLVDGVLAGVLSIVARQSAASMGKPFEEEADAAMRQQVEEQIERESLPMFMSGKLYDDGIIDPRDTRTVLG
ncbi:MAG: enoyl-CoA hydratase-related protein, partial [Actinomycetes bacterium]